MADDKDRLTAPEVAWHLDVTPVRVWQLRHALGGAKVGRDWLYTWSGLCAYLEAWSAAQRERQARRREQQREATRRRRGKGGKPEAAGKMVG
ncbi:hypothetical protein JCM15519_06990 [Fundidesulfovibrio butyratiphilus]